MIVGRELTKGFAEDTILEDVDVHVRQGHVMGVVGPGGVGKSLLIKMLCGLVTPDEGTVEVFGADLATLSATELARVRERIGMLFQNYALFDFMTVGENVAFPLVQMGKLSEEEIAHKVAERLTEVDLPGVEDHFPNELSGGMKKRVSLARATIADADVYLYDDPTAGLDPVTSSKIFRLIQQLHKPTGATVVVSHDIDRMVSVCDEWVVLHEGRVWLHGDTETVMASDDPVVRTFFDGASIDGEAA